MLASVIAVVAASLGVEAGARLGVEVDTNARRAVPEQPGVPTDGGGRPVEVVTAPLTRASLSVRTRLEPEEGRHRLELELDLGAKRFFGEGTEDLIAVEIGVASRHRLGRFGLLTHARHRTSRMRSPSRDHDLQTAGLTVAGYPGEPVELGLGAHVSRFGFLPEPRFDHWGPTLLAHLSWTPDRSWSVRLEVGRTWRWYAGNGLVEGRAEDGASVFTFCDPPPPGVQCASRPRRDETGHGGAKIAYAHPDALAELGYRLRLQRSTTPLESADWHRVDLGLTAPLPLELIGSVRGVLQLSDRTAPLVGEQLVEDDEYQSSVQLQLERPLARWVDLQLRYAWYFSAFWTTEPRYERHTTYLGVSMRPLGSG